jgi:N-acetyl-gamma-glutamyl-phosphate reductase
MINAGIVGAAGYTGGELIRLLLRHPEARLAWAQSHSQAGKTLCAIHQDLVGETDMLFSGDFTWDVDVLFLCGGHGKAKALLEQKDIPHHVRIIDLSQDFRLKHTARVKERDFVYGLPELNRSSILKANNIANPGCFATAMQLGLLPLVAAGFSGSVYATGITGATGAGQSLSESSHFSWRSNNIQAYKSLQHQHLAEVGESMQQAGGGEERPAIHFVPWRGDFARGIFISQQLRTDKSLGELKGLYRNYYEGHPFAVLSNDPIHLKQVVNTNKCLIQIEKHEGQTVIHAAIDNLLKGASGQAVQNMNLMCGLEETMGLRLKANYF